MLSKVSVSHSTCSYLVASGSSMERPVQKGKNVNTKSDCEMWERGVFGSPHHVCSVNRQGLCFWVREMPILLGLETVVTGQPRDQAARLRQTTR